MKLFKNIIQFFGPNKEYSNWSVGDKFNTFFIIVSGVALFGFTMYALGYLFF